MRTSLFSFTSAAPGMINIALRLVPSILNINTWPESLIPVTPFNSPAASCAPKSGCFSEGK